MCVYNMCTNYFIVCVFFKNTASAVCFDIVSFMTEFRVGAYLQLCNMFFQILLQTKDSVYTYVSMLSCIHVQCVTVHGR